MIALDAIGARRAELDPAAAARRVGRGLLTLVAGVLLAAGWLAARAVTATIAAAGLAWLALLWCVAAAELGYRDVRPSNPKETTK